MFNLYIVKRKSFLIFQTNFEITKLDPSNLRKFNYYFHFYYEIYNFFSKKSHLRCLRHEVVQNYILNIPTSEDVASLVQNLLFEDFRDNHSAVGAFSLLCHSPLQEEFDSENFFINKNFIFINEQKYLLKKSIFKIEKY